MLSNYCTEIGENFDVAKDDVILFYNLSLIDILLIFDL